eukprot:TRINITY_DN40_c0_g1_i11.p1 TRINITY_DN40_c0_g1~~TRINITY_DN40_c0_g1_i11.p1  ORF type:complete len:485 (+),score=146.40 TRINITY_DN40_c0_g1_i11:166-1455(+)
MNVNERTLDDEFRHILSIVHRQEPLNKQQANFITWEVVEYWKDNINPGFLEYRKSVSDEHTAIEWRDGTDGGGSKFYGIKGKAYIDCLGGYGIYNVGHRHPVVISAVRAQLRKQALHSQELLDPLRAYCAHLLAKIAPGDLKYAFFGNSGTEAVEACIKMTILATKRHHFVALVGGFHGKSLGALACTSKAVFRGPFVPALMKVTHVPRNDIATLKSVMDGAASSGEPIAGVIMEPVMGEGGIFVLEPEYLQAARDLCDEHDSMLIFDEVQSGMGRTGKWFACEWAGVSPDLMALAKGLGGGVQPVGACLGSERVWGAYIDNPFIHTTTFGGNPLAMAAAIATMFVIHSENLCDAATEKGEIFQEGFAALLSKYPKVVKEARGRGLMMGLEFHTNEIGYAYAAVHTPPSTPTYTPPFTPAYTPPLYLHT